MSEIHSADSSKAGPTTRAIGELLPEICSGNPSALNEVVTIAYRRIESVIRGLRYQKSGFGRKGVRGDDQTGIILTEVYLRLHNAVTPLKLTQLNRPSGFWVVVANNVRYVLLDHARSRQKSPESLSGGTSDDDDFSGYDIAESARLQPEMHMQRIEMMEAVESLPEEHRSLIDMFYYLGLKQSEITEILAQDDPKIHARKVSRMIDNARDELRKKVNEM